MTRPIGTVPTGGGASGGAVETVNGLPGPNPVVTASLVPSTGPSTVQADIDALAVAAAQVAGLIVIDSYAALEAAFPNVAGVHTIDQQTLWVSQTGAPIAHPAGFSTVLVHPGSMAAVGPSKVLIVGDVAGPLLSGEIIADGITILNVNPLGSDVSMESLAGRPVSLSNVTLLGQDAGTIANCLGVALVNVAVQPAAPGAAGLVIDGVNAVQRWDSVAAAPGGAPYVAWSVAATATIIADLRFDGCAFFGAGVAGDAMLYIDPLANLPTAALPTNVVGLEVFGCSIKQGALFGPGSLDQTAITILSSSNTGGPTSQFIGSIKADTQATAVPVEIEQVYVASNAWEVVPSDNAPAVAPNDVVLTLDTALSQRHTLIIDARQDYRLRYDGPEDELVRAVSWEATAERQGGSAQVVDAQLEADFNDGMGWVELPNTRDTILTTATLQAMSGKTVLSAVNNGFSLRLVSRTTSSAVNTYWGKVQIGIGF